MRHSLLLVAALAAFSTTVAAATSGHAGHAMPMADAAAGSAKAVEPTSATVKKIDPAAGKLTLQHGPLTNLGMPAMTMTFKAADPAVLGRLKVGDTIRFVAEMAGKDYLATRVEKAK